VNWTECSNPYFGICVSRRTSKSFVVNKNNTIYSCLLFKVVRNSNAVKQMDFPYFPSAGPGADPGVQAVIRSQAVSNHYFPSVQSCGHLPSRRTSPSFYRYRVFIITLLLRHWGSTNTYRIPVTRCEQLAQGCYAALSQWELIPRPRLFIASPPPFRYATAPLRTWHT